ncbi:MAG TPA: DUF4157 domain-containing protein [Nitrospira sp.]|nr:DUF4157 domain-containing protein [Nitrospira sp.]
MRTSPARSAITPLSGFAAGLPLFFQPKLVISRPDDPAEQEADRVAEQVMRMPESAVQRQCAACANGGTSCPRCEGDKKLLVQRDAPAAAGEAGRAVSARVGSNLGPGRPLDAATRAFFEPRFGHDFSRVRVHTGAAAEQSAKGMNAHAYAMGHEIVFGAGRFTPGTHEGRQLLAHELTHVVQQAGGSANVSSPGLHHAVNGIEPIASSLASRRFIQRDLATPPPTPASPPQPDLTEAQIREAIRFNRDRYNEANTRLIQDILGGPVTGSWTRENILAIAATQEEYGLTKDGKVGPDTFRFIVREQELEGAGTDTDECLTMFRVIVHPVQTAATAGPGGTTQIRGHHVVDAQFSSRCDCSEFQYRQFISGVATGSRGGASQDLSTSFGNIPGGRLPISPREDGMTHCAGVNYGHREQPSQDATTTRCGENRYTDDAGTTDQANGCIYRGEDFPAITVNGLNTGDDVDLLVEFRGEIQRNGRAVQTRRWTTVDTTVRTP